MQALRPPAPDPAALLAGFRASHPNVEVRVRHGGGSIDMVAQVAAGRLDLALVGAPGAPGAVTLIPLFAEPIDLVCVESHQLARREAVTLIDLTDEVFAELPPAWGSRALNDLAFTARGLVRSIGHEINDVATLLSFVARDLAIALLPRSMASDVPRTVHIPVSDHAHPFRVSLATPTMREPADESDESTAATPGPAARALAHHIVARSP